MGNRSSVVGLKGSQDLKRRRKYPHNSIVAPKEQVLGSRADAADFVVLKERLALIVGLIDLADLEVIERFPLLAISIIF